MGKLLYNQQYIYSIFVVKIKTKHIFILAQAYLISLIKFII